MAPVLDIYVASHCFGTPEARRLAGKIRHMISEVQVNVREINSMESADATSVFATPSYYLDGHLIFLGNPRPDELVARLQSARILEGDKHD